MNENSVITIDWSRLHSERRTMHPEEIFDSRDLLVNGLSRAIRSEVSPLLMKITVSLKKAKLYFSVEGEEIEDANNPMVKMEMMHVFDEERDRRGGVLIPEIPDPVTISYFQGLYKPEDDIILSVHAANDLIRRLNKLGGGSYWEFYLGAHQIFRLFESLRHGNNDWNNNGY